MNHTHIFTFLKIIDSNLKRVQTVNMWSFIHTGLAIVDEAQLNGREYALLINNGTDSLENRISRSKMCEQTKVIPLLEI